jgi:hypothetical protein
VFQGCDHESVGPRLGWAMTFFPWCLIAVAVPRRFPDFFTGFPPVLTFAPRTVSFSPTGFMKAVTGRFDRTSGHLDLRCDVRVIFAGFTGLPPLLYGDLEFGASTYSGLFTTRSVPRTVAPRGTDLVESRSTGQQRS